MNVLVVEDEPKIQGLFQARFENRGHQVFTAESGEAAVAALGQQQVQLVITDWSIKGQITRQDLLTEMKRLAPQAPVIVVTGFSDTEANEYLKMGASGFMQKPINLTEFDELVQKVCPSYQPAS